MYFSDQPETSELPSPYDDDDLCYYQYRVPAYVEMNKGTNPLLVCKITDNNKSSTGKLSQAFTTEVMELQ